MSEAGAVFVGIDLAADPARTGMAIIHDAPDKGRVVLQEVQLGVDDESLIQAITGASKAGVDVPFGWPVPFVELVSAHSAGTMKTPPDAGAAWRRSIMMRRTDLFVRERFGLIPLSVASDRIAYPAIRWAAVTARLQSGGIDCRRDGSGRVCEVYPAAALRSWGLAHRGYKRAPARAERERLVESLEGVVPWLDWNGVRDHCVRSDDILDATVAALIAREAAAGRTLMPRANERDLALREGWIHVPAGWPPLR